MNQYRPPNQPPKARTYFKNRKTGPNVADDARIVRYYGVHWDDDGLAWFLDGKRGINASDLNRPCPFIVRTESGNRHCNHQIGFATSVVNEYAWAYFLEIATDPIIDAMLPIPHTQKLFWIDDDDRQIAPLLSMLASMSAPIYPIVRPAESMLRLAKLQPLFGISNIQPLALTGVTYEQATLLHPLARMVETGVRTLILTGGSDVPVPDVYQKISPEVLLDRDFLELNQLPWASLGVTVIRKYMRGEWPPRRDPDGGYEFVSPKRSEPPSPLTEPLTDRIG